MSYHPTSDRYWPENLHNKLLASVCKYRYTCKVRRKGRNCTGIQHRINWSTMLRDLRLVEDDEAVPLYPELRLSYVNADMLRQRVHRRLPEGWQTDPYFAKKVGW